MTALQQFISSIVSMFTDQQVYEGFALLLAGVGVMILLSFLFFTKPGRKALPYVLWVLRILFFLIGRGGRGGGRGFGGGGSGGGGSSGKF